MNQPHTQEPTPPRRIPPVLEQLKRTYQQWLPIHRNFPKSERFGLGQKIDGLFLGLLETIHRAAFAAGATKLAVLGEALLTVDSLRFFLQLAWEVKLIPTAQYAALGESIESIGKMVGGWRRGLIAKSAPVHRGTLRE